MNFVLKLILFVGFFFYTGCSVREPVHQSLPYLISIKTPQMAFSDTGFINESTTQSQLQIFNAGTLVLNIEIGQNICIDGTCLSKEDFNKRFFGAVHYADLLENIIHQKALFEGIGYTKTSEGFSQQINLPDAMIDYRVANGSLFFKEAKHNILIRLKPLQ